MGGISVWLHEYNPSIRRGLGIMFGFVAVSVLVIETGMCQSAASVDIPPDAWWFAAKAASSATVHDWLSTTYFNLIRDFVVVIVEIAILFFALREGELPDEGWLTVVRHLISAISNKWIKAGGYAIGVFALFYAVVFLYNLVLARDLFICDPPKVNVVWTQNKDGFEIPKGDGPFSMTSEYIRDNRQYVLDIEYPKKYGVPAFLDGTVEFPFPVTKFQMEGGPSAKGTFSPMFSPVKLKIQGPNVHLTGQLYRSYRLQVDGMQPGAHVRLVVTLNIVCDVWGHACAPSNPLYEYLSVRTNYSFGGLGAGVDAYAPFEVDESKNVNLGTWRAVPPNLQIEMAVY